MNCAEVQELLSAYHDSELSPEVAARVAAHIAGCPTCSEELASFEQLSGLSRRLTDPPVPSHMWEDLRSQLDAGAMPSGTQARFLPKQLSNRVLALAATILVVVGAGFLLYQADSSHGHDELTENFSHYLDEFSQRPDEAQRILLAKYDGQPVTIQEAANALGYEPLAAKGLPPDCSLEKVYLLDMPCCKCAQIVCKDSQGRSIAIFEHAIDEPKWFGGRPTIECICHDTPTSVVQVGDSLAATWKNGKRFITIIGAKDLEEVTSFVSYFSGSHSGES